MTQIKGAEGGFDIEIDDQVAQGKYSNLAILSHSRSEFIVDFATKLPGLPKPKVISRIVMTPEHAKRLLYSLQENVARYESTHGPIEIHQREQNAPSLRPVGEA